MPFTNTQKSLLLQGGRLVWVRWRVTGSSKLLYQTDPPFPCTVSWHGLEDSVAVPLYTPYSSLLLKKAEKNDAEKTYLMQSRRGTLEVHTFRR